MATIGSAAHRSDIVELERLKNLAERDSVKALLDTVIAKSQKLLERAEDSEKQEELKTQERQRIEEARKRREAEMAAQGKVMPQPIGREKAKIQNVYITTGYGWDQSDMSVMLYLTIKDADTLTEDQYKLDVQAQSINFDVYNHNGANYNFKISKLAKEIIPEKCRVKLKKAQIILFLRKKEQGKQWPELRYKSTRDVYNELVRAEEKGELIQFPDDMQSKMKEMFENSDPETRRMMEETYKQARDMKANGGKYDPLAAMAGMGMPGMPGLSDMFGGHSSHTHGPNCSHQH
ncbi:hypothetical protein INT44_001329 [Umbelopsis vinacea]|uniref:CS domain-containing protein n=1 Tax=Umbelopsis vinacea TaxID=44442 RepID=A0A8H7URT4_9FUNG|nr:hypothetical protein INT44_001329 [Umbelopsis vinacea]